MTEIYFTKGMQKLVEFYDYKKMSIELIGKWYPYFLDYSNEEFKYAVEEYIKTEVYFPNVASLRKKIESLKISENDMAEEFASFVIEELHKGFPISMKKIRDLNFKKYGSTALAVLDLEAESLSRSNIEDLNGTTKAQLRNLYRTIALRNKNEQIIKDNNLPINNNLIGGSDLKGLIDGTYN